MPNDKTIMKYFGGLAEQLCKSPIMNKPGSGKSFYTKTYGSFVEREKMKAFANDALKNGEVHYVDMTDNQDRFIGLLPECQTISDDRQFAFLLHDLNELYTCRIKMHNEGDSLEALPGINLIVYELSNLSGESIKGLRELMMYTLEKQRLAKMVYVLHDPTQELSL